MGSPLQVLDVDVFAFVERCNGRVGTEAGVQREMACTCCPDTLACECPRGHLELSYSCVALLRVSFPLDLAYLPPLIASSKARY